LNATSLANTTGGPRTTCSCASACIEPLTRTGGASHLQTKSPRHVTTEDARDSPRSAISLASSPRQTGSYLV
jgi:hypothetical protein